MIYPNSNLPTVSQPWGRAVQKGLETLEATIISNEVNNKARDVQLQNSYIQVNKSVQDVKFAISQAGIAVGGVNEIKTNIYVPGTTKINGTAIETGTLSATTINGGTINSTVSITGSLIKSSGVGARIEISGTSLRVYNATLENPVASMYGDANGFLINAGVSSISLGDIGVSIDGGSSNILVLDTGTVVTGNIDMMNDADTYGAFQTHGSATFLLGASFSSSINTSGIVNTGGISNQTGNVNSPGTYSNNVQSGRIMYVASNGTYNCATSSARYKQDINPYVVDVNKFFQLEPVSFRYKMAVEQFGEQADIAHGFIAEQAAEIGLDEFVDFQDDGNGGQRPDNFRYIDFTAAMYAVIKSQQEVIKSLSDRIEVLESA